MQIIKIVPSSSWPSRWVPAKISSPVASTLFQPFLLGASSSWISHACLPTPLPFPALGHQEEIPNRPSQEAKVDSANALHF